jgi:formate-dependent nitrite reductase membrane component NrfD
MLSNLHWITKVAITLLLIYIAAALIVLARYCHAENRRKQSHRCRKKSTVSTVKA